MYAIGYDIGSSSIKAALVNLASGARLGIAQYPESEMPITAIKAGWAEQDPEEWWKAVCHTSKQLLAEFPETRNQISSIGISYQMHGLVLVDKHKQIIRPAIIWCDSRAIPYGDSAYKELGSSYCLEHLLNSPGNFTAAKLAWVQEHEPENYSKIHKIMLPGDYIAMRLTENITTSMSGLSEGIFWDFRQHVVSKKILEHFNIDASLLPEILPCTSEQGVTSNSASKATGLAQGIPVTYRAGDQANNALSLSILEPGEIAATGGTSGVVYGVSDQLKTDSKQRINSFAHVNHSKEQIRIGQLLCINGAGSQYAWIRKQIHSTKKTYAELESRIANIPVGSLGLRMIPFGNGAERMLNNLQTGAQLNNLQFALHTKDHIIRAGLEGIAFAFVYGIHILQELGVDPQHIRVGNDNLFQSPVFSSTIAEFLGCEIQVMDTTGADGAAKASGIAQGFYSDFKEAVANTPFIQTFSPTTKDSAYENAYQIWKNDLNTLIKNK